MSDNREHSPLGGSGAHRWMNCPASARLSEQFGDQSSAYAEEGTRAHALAAEWLETSTEPVGLRFVEPDEREAISTYVDYVLGNLTPDTDMRIEETFHLDHVHEDMWGSADCVLIEPNIGHLMVIDYKHGVGVPVAATENPQLMYYALGVYRRVHNQYPDISDVTLAIVQPRSLRRGEPISEWFISVADLLEFEALLREAGQRADEGVDFNPGPWCRFCKASGQCEAQYGHVLDLLGITEKKGELILPDEEIFDRVRMGRVLRNSQQITGFLNRLKERAFDAALEGHPPEGMKLVQGRRRREWANEDEAKAYLADELGIEDVEETKMRSPAQVEKMLPRADRHLISEHVAVSYGSPQLAPLDDPRPAIAPDIDTDLEGV